MQPSPQPVPSAEAVDLAAKLRDLYGKEALAGARTALQLASRAGTMDQAMLWQGVVEILIKDTWIMLAP